MPKVLVDTEDYVSVNDAAGKIGVGVATIWRWKKSGKILTMKLVGRTLVPKSECERLKLVKTPVS